MDSKEHYIRGILEQREAASKMISGLHETLWQFCKSLPTDFEPYGQRSREDDWGPDCSCGCKHMLFLEGSGDWGVCCNPESPRAGLLTWEHMGCKNFVDDPEVSERLKKWIESAPGYIERRDAFLIRAEAYRAAHPERFGSPEKETEPNV